MTAAGATKVQLGGNDTREKRENSERGTDRGRREHRRTHPRRTRSNRPIRRRRRLQADTLVQAADLLHQATVKQLNGGHTPLDTKNAIEAWLRQQAAELQAANGTQ